MRQQRFEAACAMTAAMLRAGQAVFGGSGSTLIACEQTGRNAFLMELDPLSATVIVQRWEQFTGEKAIRPPIARPSAKRTACR